MEIGTTIRDIRLLRGMQQAELALRIGLSQTAVSQIETGATTPRHVTIKKICKVLKVSEPFLYLMAITEQDVPKSKRRQFAELFPTAKQIIKSIFELNPHDIIKRTEAAKMSTL
jgi:transcriptional regulator with XRE-family HTH domain